MTSSPPRPDEDTSRRRPGHPVLRGRRPPTPGGSPLVGGRRAWAVALLFTLPFVLLAAAWLVATPSAGAPDEDAHLVKALAAARGDLGTPVKPAPPGSKAVVVRNASISRVVTIPGALNPNGYACFAFRSNVTASCQQALPARHPGDGKAITTLGAYPPFLYPPLGWAASLGHNPHQAFLLGRAVVLVETALLLLLASWHLVRWLGRRSLLGLMVFATPVAVFCMAILNTSGVEIFSTVLLAAIVVTYSRRPDSLRARSTQLLLGLGGCLLVLSRQLGVVTMGALVLLFLALGGWIEVVEAVRRRSRLFLGVVALVGVCTVATTAWELRFDHPALTGSLLGSDGGWDRWWGPRWLPTAQSGIGWFGWLDVRMIPGVSNAWLLLIAGVVALAVLVGRWRDRAAVVCVFAAFVGVASVVYVTVFDPVQAGLQGRHMLPFLAIVVVYAGVVVAERLPRLVVSVLVVALALTLPLTQLYGFMVAGERNAVGLPHVSWFFVPRATWSPPWGWTPWIGLAVAACALMALSWIVLAVTASRDVLTATHAGARQ